MVEKTRQEIIKGRENLEKGNEKKVEIINEIKSLVEELKNDEIIIKLKKLGNEYKKTENINTNILENEKKILEDAKEACKHPILCRMGYIRHNESNRIVKAFKEDAEYSKVKCLECGKITYTMGKSDGNSDWEYYIHTPMSLLNLGVDFIERPIIDIPANLSFKEIYNYYQEEMYKGTERETVIKVLKKYKNE